MPRNTSFSVPRPRNRTMCGELDMQAWFSFSRRFHLGIVSHHLSAPILRACFYYQTSCLNISTAKFSSSYQNGLDGFSTKRNLHQEKDTPIQVNLLFLVVKNGGMEKQGSCVVSNLRTQLEWGANRDSFRLKNRFNTSYCF